jgi:hypothetical protein
MAVLAGASAQRLGVITLPTRAPLDATMTEHRCAFVLVLFTRRRATPGEARGTVRVQARPRHRIEQHGSRTSSLSTVKSLF